MFHALGGIVAFLAYIQTAVAPSEACSIKNETNFRGLRLFERVYVSYYSGHIQSPCSSLEHRKFVCGQNAEFGNRVSNFAFWPDIHPRHNLSIGNIRKLRPAWNGIISISHGQVGREAVSWRLTEILNSNSDTWPLARCYVSHSGSLDEDVGSQLPFGGILRTTDQTSRGPKERTSSGGQNDGCDKQSGSKTSQVAGQVNEPPIKFRFLLAFASLLFCVFFSFLGWRDVDNDRPFRGALLVCISLVIGTLGMGLFWITRFADTWDWWL